MFGRLKGCACGVQDLRKSTLCRSGAAQPWTWKVAPSSRSQCGLAIPTSRDQTLTYTLAKLTINVGRVGYLVRVYNGADGSGAEWGNAWSDATGATAFYLVEGDYGYLVEKNSAKSAKTGFTVARSTDQTLTYTLAKVTVNVGRVGYLVRVYNGADGSGAEWGNAWSDATGATAFYLVEGDYGYLVEKNAATSAKTGFTVARSTDQTLAYTLAKVTVNVGRVGYLVRVYNGADGSGAEVGQRLERRHRRDRLLPGRRRLRLSGREEHRQERQVRLHRRAQH